MMLLPSDIVKSISLETALDVECDKFATTSKALYYLKYFQESKLACMS